MIQLLIADQHTLMRSGLRRLLSDEPGLSVVAEAGKIEQVFATLRIGKVDVLLMDMNLPGMDSVEATRRLLRMDAELRIVVLGAYVSGPYPVHLFKAGIAGYLTKASSGEEMVACIRKVARGQRHVSADIAQTLLLDHIEDGNTPLGCLTPRELSVLVLLSRGDQRCEISTKLWHQPQDHQHLSHANHAQAGCAQRRGAHTSVPASRTDLAAGGKGVLTGLKSRRATCRLPNHTQAIGEYNPGLPECRLRRPAASCILQEKIMTISLVSEAIAHATFSMPP